jgi:AcrR family transcriptional regulator
MTQAPLSSREKILDVAEALFARRGFEGVGMREVATAAGLGKSSLFHHFSGKPQMYYEVLGRVIGRIHERVAPVLVSHAGPVTKLDRLVDELIDVLAEQPTTARLLLRALFEEEAAAHDQLPEAVKTNEVLADMLEGMRRLLREGVDEGVFRPVSVSHTMQTLIGATVYHFASGELGDQLLGRPLFSAEAVARRKEEIHNLLHHGLVARPA